MKVVCIKDFIGYIDNVYNGTMYDAMYLYSDHEVEYYIINGLSFPISNFMTLDEYREEQLSKIL